MEDREKKIDKPLRRGTKMLWYYLRPHRRQILVLAMLGLISSIAAGSVPYIVGKFFDALVGLKSWSGFSALWPVFSYLGIWFAAQAVMNLLDWVDDRLQRRINTNVHLEIRSAGFKHLLRLPLSFHKSERIAETLERFNSAGWMSSNIVQTLVNVTPQFLSIIVGITISFLINPILAFILIAGVTVYVIIMIGVVRQSAPLFRAGMKVWSETWDQGNAAATQADAVKQAVAENYEEQSIGVNARRAFDTWFKMELVWNRVNAAQRVLVMLTQLGIFATSVYLIATGKITPGELVALNGYALMFFGPFVQLGYAWQNIQNGLTAAARTEEIIAMEQENYHPAGSNPNIVLSGDIAFKNVSFSYGENLKPILTDITFTATPGQTIALVGESGVGKSTLISLISAYFFPTAGSVLINGIDSRSVDLEALRQQIAVVPQEVALFNDTIEMNIRYGTFAASHEEVVRAAREAHVDEFIESLPKKYETLVGERGVKLSVGQKQRVAIARALLRDPKILILDEPTSALDAKTEKLLTESLEKLMEGRTTFIIAHRLSTVRKADVILTIEGGTIVESGSHRELLAKNGVYKHLYDLQIGLHE